MSKILVDEEDLRFVLFEQLNVAEFCDHDVFKELSRESMEMLLVEAYKLSVREAMPLNSLGDREGCKIVDGAVKVPAAFHDIWKLFTDWGWLRLTVPSDAGGFGLPNVIGTSCLEMCYAANYAFCSFINLTKGVARLIINYGNQNQKEKYVSNMLSGKWTGTMCLTEPGAGSDLGALKTKAVRNADGTFLLRGSKLFISAGEHDLTQNIVHAVLARIDGAPSGSRGISLFLVPKYRATNAERSGELNDVKATGLERKLGYHGSPTCSLIFGEEDNCVGELLGEENQGLRIMFQMMNEARLDVGLGALALSSAAYLHSLEYAKTRIQGKFFGNRLRTESHSVPIVCHQDVRRMLMTMKCLVEGMRSMAYYCAYCMDKVKIADNHVEGTKWQAYIDLLTPVIKAYLSETGFHVVNIAMQVYGGYGYTQEYPIEQLLRDCKITTIFEGTNGIQAIDLLARKLLARDGEHFHLFLNEIESFCRTASNMTTFERMLTLLAKATAAVREAGDFLRLHLKKKPEMSLSYAQPFLHLFGDVILAWQLIWQACIAKQRLLISPEHLRQEMALKSGDVITKRLKAAFYHGKIASAHFLSNNLLPIVPTKATIILSGEATFMEVPEYCL